MKNETIRVLFAICAVFMFISIILAPLGIFMLQLNMISKQLDK